MIDQGAEIGFYLYWFQIFICNKCNLCNLLNNSFLCLLRLAVFLRCSRSFSWLLCKWSSGDCLVDILRVSEKTGCSSGLEWTSINNRVQSLYSLNSVYLLFAGINNRLFFWYYNFCLLFWLTELLNQLVSEINSF